MLALLAIGIGRSTHAPFLSEALGKPAPRASLVRHPAHGLRVEIQRGGFEVVHRGTSVSLQGASAGRAWKHYAHGAERPTPFGRETVVVGSRTTEQFLTVDRRQGERTWRWRLQTGGLTPRLNQDGTVVLHDGALSGVSVDPARILTPGGRDITPAGLRWSVGRQGGAWWLSLRVDDTKLPLPYVIDPAITLRGVLGANNGAGAASITESVPAGVAANDFMLAVVSVHGGSGRTISAPGGWTLLRRENQGANLAQAIYYRTASGSEPASYQWTFNASDKATGGIVAYVGVNLVNPIDQSSGGVSGVNGNAVTAPSVTTSANNARVVGFFGMNKAGTFTPPGGTNERWDQASGATSSEAADLTQAVAGATGAKTATSNQSNAWVGQLVALNLDSTPPSAPSLSINESSADSYVSGTTFWYRPTGAGSTFTVNATTSDGQSGLQKVTFPGLGGGFTPSTDTDDTSSPYSLVYTWPNGGAESGPQTVTAVDNAGGTAGTDFTISADPNPPATTDNTASIGSGWTNTNQTVTLTPSDNGETGVAATYYTTDGSPPTTGSTQGTSVSLTANGTYTVKYFSTDNVGNQESVQTAGTQVRIDKTNPSTATLDALPGTISRNQVLTGSGTDALSGVASISYYYCPGSPCTPSTLVGTSSTGPTYAVTWSSEPPDGTYQVLARVSDAAGNTLDSSKQTVDIANAPVSTIDSSPANPSSSSTAAFDFSADDPVATFECQLDGGGFSACTAPKTYLSLGAGAHTFQVRGTNGNGVGDPIGYTWTIDLTAPNTTVDTNPANPTSATGATFTFSSTEGGSTFECQLDGGGFTSCSSPKSYAGLTGGAHTFQVRATDPAGNTDASPASYGWTIDLTPPDTSITSSPANPTNATGASFSLSSTEAGSTFECELDGGGFSSCSSPKSYAGLSAGSHTFQVRATDAVGNTDATPASFTWTIDTAAPDTSITSGPPVATNATAATFSFTSTEPGSAFQCQLDGGGFGACTSPQTYLSLGAGSHTFQVRATDTAGNADPTVASQTWTIDTTAPNTSVDAGPSNPTGATGASFTFSSTEGGSTFECQLDGGGFTSCTSPTSYAGPLSGGSHTFQVRATDPAGNQDSSPASWSWTIDSTAPTASVDTGPSSPTTATGAACTFSANEPSTFDCQLDAGAWLPCSTPKAYAGLGNGAHTFQVRATDTVGNTGSPASYNWTIDLSPPDTTITVSPASPTSLTDASFSFTSTEPGSTFECQLDGGAYGACTSPRSYSGLASGTHTFQVRATDPVGNTDPTPASGSWTIDNVAPTAAIDFGPADPTGSTSATFTFSSSEGGSTFQCQLDGGGYGACTSPATYAGLAEGQHTFRVKAIDAVGNVGAAATQTWNIDRTPPDAVIGSSASNPSNTTTATFTFSASEAGSTFQCQLDGGGYSGCSSPKTYTALASGTHAFQVKATDPLGNAGSSDSQSWTIDTTAPTVGLDDPGAVLAGTVHLTAAAGDANGVGSVRFERSPAGANMWVTIDTDNGAPYAADFVTGSAADGFWDLRAVATDAAGNTTVTPVATRRVDNTAPTASLAISKLYVRATAQLTATAADDGSGITSVVFQRSPRGANSWSTIAVATAAPYATSFDPSGLSDGQYDLRAVVTDAAGNAASPSLAVVVATSSTGVSLDSPGAALTGTVSLKATTSGVGAQQVTFEIKRSGSSNWVPVATDLVAPWGASFDTSLLRDGTYDLRATTLDADGVPAVDVLTGIRIDNTAPELAKSVPAGGAKTTSSKVALTADEAIVAVTGVKLDGSATVVPTIRGTTATFDFRAMKPGAHTLTGTMEDAAGLKTPFTLRFTVVGTLTARLGAPHRSAGSLAVPVTVSGPSSITVRLLSPRGRTLARRNVKVTRKGTYQTRLRVPATLAAGRYTVGLVATGGGVTVRKSSHFTVAAPSRPGATWVIIRG
jgi:hypothetical protein